MAVKKIDKDGFIIGPDGKPLVNSINQITGKKVMPKSTGRPKGSRDKLQKPKATILDGKRGEQLRKNLEDTVVKGNEELIARGRELAEQEHAGSPDDVGAIMGMRRDELATLCYRLATRGLSSRQIAEQMKLTTGEVDRLTKRLSQALRLEPKTLDVGFYMGESLAFFTEIRQIAMLAASTTGNSASLKLRALEVAMNAEDRKNAFLTKIGVYSPTVVERIEQWIVTTTESMAAPPSEGTRVNLAAEIGRALARRARAEEEFPPEPVEDANVVEDVTPRGSNA